MDLTTGPHRERTEPDRLTHSNFSTADGTTLAKDRQEPETPRMKPTHVDTLERNLECRNDIECKHNLFQQAIEKKDNLECDNDEAAVAGHFMTELLRKCTFGQQHALVKGLQKFGEQGVKGTEK